MQIDTSKLMKLDHYNNYIFDKYFFSLESKIMYKNDGIKKVKAVNPCNNQGFLYYNCFDVNNVRVKISMKKVFAEISKYESETVEASNDSI